MLESGEEVKKSQAGPIKSVGPRVGGMYVWLEPFTGSVPTWEVEAELAAVPTAKEDSSGSHTHRSCPLVRGCGGKRNSRSGTCFLSAQQRRLASGA